MVSFEVPALFLLSRPLKDDDSLSDRRSAVIQELGRCCCSIEREKKSEEPHGCGLDCSSWGGDCCLEEMERYWRHDASFGHQCASYMDNKLTFWGVEEQIVSRPSCSFLHRLELPKLTKPALLLDLSRRLQKLYVSSTWISPKSLRGSRPRWINLSLTSSSDFPAITRPLPPRPLPSPKHAPVPLSTKPTFNLWRTIGGIRRRSPLPSHDPNSFPRREDEIRQTFQDFKASEGRR